MSSRVAFGKDSRHRSVSMISEPSRTWSPDPTLSSRQRLISSTAPDNKPAIVFVPSRKQSQLTAIDMVTYAAADGQPDRFLTVGEDEIAPVLETVREPALQQTLGHGVGFIHQGMLEADRTRVEGLFKDGIIKVRGRGRVRELWTYVTAGVTW